MSSSWHDHVDFEGRDGRAGQAEVHVLGSVSRGGRRILHHECTGRLTQRLRPLRNLSLKLAFRDDAPETRVRAIFPASRSSALGRLIQCSDTFSRRNASATETSFARTENMILVVLYTEICGGRPMTDSAIKARTTALPNGLTHDNYMPRC